MWLGNRLRILGLLCCDGAIAVLCGLAAIYVRFGEQAPAVISEQHVWWRLLLLAIITMASFYLFELYNLGLGGRASRRWKQPLSVLQSVGQAVGLISFTLALTFYVAPQMKLGRGVFLVSLVLMVLLMSGWRLLAAWMLGQRALAERVLILGTGDHAVAIAREALRRRESGYEVVGFIGEDPLLVGRSLINPCVLGVTDDLRQVAHHYRVNRVVVATGEMNGRLPFTPLLDLRLGEQLAVEEAASFYERLTGKVSWDQLPNRLVFADTSLTKRLYQRAKRLMDISLAAVALPLSSPLMLVAAIAIKLDSPGAIFYRQERVGQYGRTFDIIKLRSMRTDAEKDGPVWAAKADARVTQIGRWLRKLRIDELPQLINVLRGEMSFIGPRPERPAFVAMLEQHIPYFAQRHLVKPGLTGWAQVRCPYCASVEEARERHQYDLYYIKNQSPALDALILLETMRVVFTGKLGR
jgi:sugar transferase (PEP-CTERM system associated)